MRERKLYDFIGEWLIREKGCQRNDYSQGYLKDVEMMNVELGGEKIVCNVLGIRYEIVKGCPDHLDFHGYIVEVKSNKSEVEELIGKAIKIKRGIEDRSLIYSFEGLDDVEIYIAYPTEQVEKWVLNECEKEGFGILRLQIIDEENVHVYEVLKAKPIHTGGVKSQRSPGVFEDEINKRTYLKQMFQNPSKLFEDFIRPSMEKYRAEMKFKEVIVYIKDEGSREALQYLINKIKEEFPQIEIIAHGRLTFQLHKVKVLSIIPTTRNFQLELDEERKYRVLSKGEIWEFEKDTGKEFKGNIDDLIESIIVPSIKSKIITEKS